MGKSIPAALIIGFVFSVMTNIAAAGNKPSFKFSAGYGFDKVKKDDINNGAGQNNQFFFGNMVYAIVDNASAGLEISQWWSEHENDDAYAKLRVQTVFILNF